VQVEHPRSYSGNSSSFAWSSARWASATTLYLRMGKASSSKKIKRVQQAGVSRAPGQRRNLGFPALILGIIVVGLVMVFYARSLKVVKVGAAPVMNQDKWYSAYGLDICGAFQENPVAIGPDKTGIYPNSDGLIQIAPFVPSAAGEKAQFGLYADQIGLKLSDGEFTLADGTTKKNGDTCTDDNGKKTEGKVVMYVWPPQATDATKPKVVTSDLAAQRFAENGQAFVLAFAANGSKPKLPPSLPALQNPSSTPASPTSVAPAASTTTTIAEGGAGAADASTTTTVAGG